VKKTDRMQLIEHRFGKTIEQLLTELTEAGLTNQGIADELGITVQCVLLWKHNLGAKRVTTLRFERETESYQRFRQAKRRRDREQLQRGTDSHAGEGLPGAVEVGPVHPSHRRPIESPMHLRLGADPPG
jgi:hypothetical protein